MKKIMRMLALLVALILAIGATTSLALAEAVTAPAATAAIEGQLTLDDLDKLNDSNEHYLHKLMIW